MPCNRILLTDDDRLVLATLAKGLGNNGYLVRTAQSGEEALQCAAEEGFDLAVLDINMPGLSGIETAQRLYEEYDLASLFLTAYSRREIVQEAVDSGGMGYVVKPVDAEQLVPAIEAAMARARDLRALMGHKKQLEQALSGSRDTSVAIGILMERRGLNLQDAFESLRAHARNHNRKLEELSHELVQAEDQLNAIASQPQKKTRQA